MNLFEAVKEVRTIDAAKLYGFRPDRAGMISCLFHQDRTPSMWLNDGFYCHGCHAKGDVIAFTAQAFNLAPKAAAQKLAQDFGIVYDGKTTASEIREKAEIISLHEQFEEVSHHFTTTAAACCRKLREWKKDLAPKDQDEILDERFILACRYLDELDHVLDEYARAGLKGKIDILKHYGRLVTHLAGK